MNEIYLKDVRSGYFDAEKLKIKFVDGYPQEVARELTDARPAMTNKQARSFFNAVNKVNTRVLTGAMDINDAIVELKMLKSRVNDKLSKGLVSNEFATFINTNVDTVCTEKDLKAFTLHFEAVCNYLKSEIKAPGKFPGNNTYNNNNYKANRR